MNLLIAEAFPAVPAFLYETVSTIVFYAVKQAQSRGDYSLWHIKRSLQQTSKENEKNETCSLAKTTLLLLFQ